MERSKQGSHPFAARPRPVSAGRKLARLAAWVLAVPVVCAAVIVGGATPLYLLLPDGDAKREAAATQAPSGEGRAATARPVAKATATKPADARPDAVAAVADEGAVDTTPTGSLTPDEGPVAEDAPPAAVSVVPTPRPVPSAPSPANGGGRQMAAIDPARPGPKAAVAPAAASGPGKRLTIRQTVNLRAAPWGQKIGVVEKGTPVVVGRCDNWCEVSVGGVHGWVHPSFIAGTRQQAKATRPDRYADRRRSPPARERDWLERERPLRSDEMTRYEPDWLYEDEPPMVARRRPPPVDYYELGPYDPYY